MNPFVVGTYISKEYFCDRRVETESLEEHVRNGRNVVLFSERRMGKTGLIQHVFHDLRIKKDFHCLYFDALACGTLQEFTFALSNSIFRSLKKESGFLEKISSFFRTLKLTSLLIQIMGHRRCLSVSEIQTTGKNDRRSLLFSR